MAISRVAWVLTLGAAALLGAGARLVINQEPDDLGAEWKPLFDKCRMAVEQAKPLDVSDLEPLQLSRRDQEELIGQRPRWRALAQPHGSFALLEKEYGEPSRSTRTCEIVRNPDLPPLSSKQEAFLHYSFTLEMNNLILKGTHEAGKPLGIFPFVSQTFKALAPNSNGCTTIAVIRTTPTARMPEFPPSFSAQVGEQTFNPCGAPSYLDQEARQKL